jgi:hypothetical protein
LEEIMEEPMLAGDRSILDVLKAELNFLGRGGYRRSAQTPWRAPLIFEDSPTCQNYYREQDARPCAKCKLLRFVPPAMQDRKVACRHIPLNAEGDTLDSLYRSAYEPEIEEAVGRWLEYTVEALSTIQALEDAPESEWQTAPKP